MPQNFDGIWEVRFFYTTTPTGFPEMEHRLTLDVAVDADDGPGQSFENIGLLQRNNLDTNLKIQVDALIALLQPFYPVSTEFSRAELWKIPEGTYNGQFYSVYEIGENGTSANPSLVAQQTTWTFRSLTGGNGRLQLMESALAGNTKLNPPYANASALALASHMISSATVWKARDNGYFFANIHLTSGQNEKLFQKRFRT